MIYKPPAPNVASGLQTSFQVRALGLLSHREVSEIKVIANDPAPNAAGWRRCAHPGGWRTHRHPVRPER